MEISQVKHQYTTQVDTLTLSQLHLSKIYIVAIMKHNSTDEPVD